MACGTSCEIKKYEFRGISSTEFKVTKQTIEDGRLPFDMYKSAYLDSYRIGRYIKACLKRTVDDRFEDTVKGDGCGANCRCIELEPAQTTTTRWVRYAIQNPLKIIIMVIYWNSNNKVDTYEIEISGQYEARAVTYKGECMPSDGTGVINETFIDSQLDSVWHSQDVYVVTSSGS